MPLQPSFIAVEGPIRAGKTTLARLLAQQLNGAYLAEPVNNPFLADFYAGRSAALAAQMWFLEQRSQQLRNMGPHSPAAPVISDYLFEKDKIFACLTLTDPELALYNRYYQQVRASLPTPGLVIYLKASPSVLQQRLRRKNLPHERAISGQYIAQIAASYEHFFSRYTASDLLVLESSDIDFVQNPRDLATLFTRLRQPVSGTHYYRPVPMPIAV